MNKSVLISGYGSIGRRHVNILSRLVKKKNLTILTNQKLSNFRTIKTLKALNEVDPYYIVICNPTSDHLKKIKFIEKNCKNKFVLIEKPLFSKPDRINIKKNKYFVGYNLRFNPIINFLKTKIKSKKIWSVNIFCGSYLPNWRNNIDYRKSSSAKKQLGGGVLLDLSHELDYVQWLFGKLKILYSKSMKLSNLEINTDDFLSLIAKTKKIPHIQITLNYFTRQKTRQIFLDGKDICLQADLIKKKVIWYKGNKKKIFQFKKFDRNTEYKEQHLAILLKKNSNKLCRFSEGKQLVDLINNIKFKSRKI
jgi:CMP-N,N'-diacetyllegionaminic acid synthase